MKKLFALGTVIICLIILICLNLPSEKANAAVNDASTRISFDISKLNDKMQAGAVFTGVEYKGDLYFISDARLYKYTEKQAASGKEPTLIVDNAQFFWIEDDAVFYSKSYGNAVYRTDLSGKNTKMLSGEKYGVCLTDHHTDGYFYLWYKTKFYSVSETDGSRTLLAKYSGNYNLYNRGRSVCFYKDRFFYSYGFEDENGSYATYPYTGKLCDYKVYSKNTDGTGRKAVLNPKGANGEFQFYELEGELFAVSGTDIYRYDEKKEKFKKVKKASFPTYRYNDEDSEVMRTYDILGSDGTYLYLYRITTEIPPELENSYTVRVDQCINTLNINRVGSDWKLETIFSGVNIRSGLGYIISEDEYMYLDYVDEDYICIRTGDEDVLPFFIDKAGNYLFSLGYFATEEEIPAGFDADESTVRARIRDGKVYMIEQDGGGHVAVAKIISLEEAIAEDNQ